MKHLFFILSAFVLLCGCTANHSEFNILEIGRAHV